MTAAAMTLVPTSDRSTQLRDLVVRTATDLGFHRIGVVSLGKPSRYSELARWLDAGFHGEMKFLERAEHRDGRADYQCILPDAVCAIVVAAAYDANAPDPDDSEGRVARYAFGGDYHRLVKAGLKRLAGVIEEATGAATVSRACVDTAPVLERDLAERAGIGFIGKNTMLISPGLGSYTVLGELFTTASIAETDNAPATDRCGECRACLDACPTSAFVAPYVLDARRCLSYLTIEHRGSINEDLRPGLADHVFGCDVCQEVCPYNKKGPSRHAPFPGLEADDSPRRAPDLIAMAGMRSGDYRRLTRGSSMRRASRAMLKRNAAIALGNQGSPRGREALVASSQGDDDLAREAAIWALEQLDDNVE